MTPESIGTDATLQDEVNQKAVVELARRHNNVREGELEIDDNATVSFGDDNGAYVQAWLWVRFDGTRFDKDTEGESTDSSEP